MVLNCEIHKKVFIYVYLQFKSEFKDNYLALTSLKIPLMVRNHAYNKIMMTNSLHTYTAILYPTAVMHIMNIPHSIRRKVVLANPARHGCNEGLQLANTLIWYKESKKSTWFKDFIFP